MYVMHANIIWDNICDIINIPSLLLTKNIEIIKNENI